MKKKNPLYVVKKDHVEPADHFIDLLIKKFNLAPLVELFQNILQLMAENIRSYAMVKVVEEFLEFIIQKLKMFQKFKII